MEYTCTPVEIWVGTVEDRTGGLAEKLEDISSAGDNLQFMLAMRNLEMPGTGVLLTSPLSAETSMKDAEQGGMSKWTTVHALRVEGPDRPGIGAKISRAVAELGISMRGVMAATYGEHAVFHLAFDSASDAEKAQTGLSAALW